MWQFLSVKRYRLRLDSKVCVPVDVVSGVPQGSFLEPLLFILYTSELFHIVRNHMLGDADDTKIYALFLDYSRVLK